MEERFSAILRVLDEKKAATVLELSRSLDASESTVRRDLTALAKMGRLHKVYGGATAVTSSYSTLEEDVKTKRDLYTDEKDAIAAYAAGLIKKRDFVYIDAGTTTAQMIQCLHEADATYVTNGIAHAQYLSSRGLKAIILGGRLKSTTEAVIGTEALNNLKFFNFTKGFFGTNGITLKSGFSTPDSEEGILKGEAMKRCKRAFVLADRSKFNRVFPITFAPLSSAAILTDVLPDKSYCDYTTIIEVQQKK
jgi:DeoR family fructose operon transcriptional repressor